MLKIIGIPTEEEANRLYNDWKQERDDWNKEVKRHNNMLIWGVITICAILIVLVLIFGQLLPTGLSYINVTLVGFILAVALIGGCIIAFNLHAEREYVDSSLPTQYKYYVATKNRNVLDSKVNDDVLDMIVENEKHEVLGTCVVGFSKKIRTDVNEVTVDLISSEILIPYNK